LTPQPAPHHQFRLGVTSPDAAHAAMPLLRCHLIGHTGAKILISVIGATVARTIFHKKLLPFLGSVEKKHYLYTPKQQGTGHEIQRSFRQ
jgi:hypothetical protein